MRTSTMKRIGPLLILAAIVGLSVGWWLESNKQPEILYLHLYSNRYDIRSMSSDLPPPPRAHECIISLSVSPGVPFFAQMPNHYEPEMRFMGAIHRRGTRIDPDFTIDLQDVGLADTHHQNTPMEIGGVIAFWDDEFRLVISEDQDAPAIDGSQ